ncbi:hypothetical protein NGM37_33095, partial [Streptomyces sp. TRM76130]|nr:hypothetical protein [Streptomyces sp. TRM76130]
MTRAPRTEPRVTTGDRSFVLREVPADGDCLMYAVLGGLASQAPASPAAGLTVRQLRDRLVRWYTGAPAA